MRAPVFPRILQALSIATLLAVPSTALASPAYPGTVQRELGLDCTPKCTLCHTVPTGGFTTVNTPFGKTARMQHGLECCNPELLADVLDELRDDETDSDDDGVTDVDELHALTSPNTADDVDLACEPSKDDSGCSVRSPGASHRDELLLLLAAAFIALAAARRFA